MGAVRDFLLDRAGVPAETIPAVTVTAELVSDSTRAQLRGTGIDVPAFDSYAATLWDYWRTHLAPEPSAGPMDPFRGRLFPITRAPLGIGPAGTHRMARHGLTGRNAQSPARSGDRG